MDTDMILENLKPTGRYQQRLLAAIFLFSVGNAWGPLTVVFVLYVPEYRCVSGQLNTSYTNETFSSNGTDEDQCFARNETANGSSIQTKCSEWIFDTEYGGETLPSEMALVCDKDWITTLVISIMMASRAFGLVIAGFLSDRFGRRPVLLCSNAVVIISTIGMAFSGTIYTYAVCLTLCGVSSYVQYSAFVIIGVEMMVPKMRNFVVFMTLIGYVVGYASLPLMAYLSPNWNVFLYVVSVGSLVFVVSYWYSPESLHWLRSKGDLKRAQKLIDGISRVNKIKPPSLEESQSLSNLKLKESADSFEGEKEKIETPIVSLLRNSTMRFRLLVNSSVWFITSLTYYAITFNTSFLPGDLYINCLVSALLELPSCALAYVMIDRAGRIKTSLIFFCVAGIACTAAPFIRSVSQIWESVMIIAGKTAISGSFYAVEVLTVEISPTAARNSFLNVCSAFSCVGSIVSPYIMYLGRSEKTELVAYVLMGVLSIIAGFLLFAFIPETAGVALPDTIAQAKDQKTIWQLKKSKSPKTNVGQSQKSALCS